MVETGHEFLSFFSGALGLDRGLEEAGLKSLAANEIDSVACQTIRRNQQSLRLYECDIRQLTADRIRDDCGLADRDLFLMCGGPPCQAFSTAGRRLGLNDDRGNVFLYFIDLIGQLRPQYVVIENVRGLLSAPLTHRPHSMRGPGHPPLSKDELPGGALHHIIELLETYGYGVSFNLYNTANFGVPQVRERVILFGSRDGKRVPDMTPTHDRDGEGDRPRWRTFRDAVRGLEGPGDHLAFPERRLRYYRLLKPGENWRDLPPDLQKEAMGNSFFAGGGKTGFYRRLAWDKPSPTLVTSPTMPATDLAHPEEDRPLSVQEYSRIQTFSDSWVFSGNLLDKYRQLGNAVPIEFGAAVGKHLIAYHSGKLIAPTARVNGLSRYKNTDRDSWAASLRTNKVREGEQLSLGAIT